MGRGKAKAQLEFSACGKCNIVAYALTKRVAAVDKIEDKRKPEDFIGHRNRRAAHADVKCGTKEFCVFLQFLCVFAGKRQVLTHLNRSP